MKISNSRHPIAIGGKRRKSTGHHRCVKGAKVAIFYRDGTIGEDWFEEAKGARMRFRLIGWVPKSDVIRMTITKGGFRGDVV